jgi:NNP family nitrate/nitrite transporter-like MFS transporter
MRARRIPELLDFSQERIRLLHWSWIAFFITFYIWFNMAPLATTMLRDLGGEHGWLTPDHIKLLAICNVAMTIPARIVIGALIDKYGPRRCYAGLMIAMAVPTLTFAFGNTFLQLLISRLVLSSIGAGFVIGIRLVAQWFPPKMVGRAEGFYAGWGNFGSAWAAMTLPWIANELFGGGHGWRWALAVNGIVSLAYGIAFLWLVEDMPAGKPFVGVKRTQPLLLSSRFDLGHYLVWSFPLVGAMGFLAWRASTIRTGDHDAAPILSSGALWTVQGVLGLVYLAHVVKTLQVNLPHLRRPVPADLGIHFNSVAALNTTYFANFGAELAVVSMLPAFFESTFTMSPTAAGLVASSFAFVNLFARPLGGLISDAMTYRKWVMVAYMAGIALGFFGMAFITAAWPLWLAVALTIACSVFVQGAEGATFAIIPMINKRMTGQIAGMAGAYGNVGAVVYLVLFSLVDARQFFLILAGGAAASVLACAVFLREPKGSHAGDDEPPATSGPPAAMADRSLRRAAAAAGGESTTAPGRPGTGAR